jgi:hypothetical protein
MDATAARVVIPSVREPHPEGTRSPSALLRTGSVEVDLEFTRRRTHLQSGEAPDWLASGRSG